MKKPLGSEQSEAIDPNNFFSMIVSLNELQAQVKTQVGPSAWDILRALDREVSQLIGPLGANYYGRSPHEVLKDHPEIIRLETQLIEKMNMANVSDIFQLIKQADPYYPTGRVIQRIQALFLQQLTGELPLINTDHTLTLV